MSGCFLWGCSVAGEVVFSGVLAPAAALFGCLSSATGGFPPAQTIELHTIKTLISALSHILLQQDLRFAILKYPPQTT
jgi:hypothetical protein